MIFEIAQKENAEVKNYLSIKESFVHGILQICNHNNKATILKSKYIVIAIISFI